MTTTYNYVDNPLSILYSCRVRLTEEQRTTLKQAHNKLRSGAAIAPPRPVLQNSSIAVEDKTAPTVDAYKTYGMSSVIVNDLINSRESISLPVLVKLQRMLGVEVVEVKQLKKQFDSYLDYVINVMD